MMKKRMFSLFLTLVMVLGMLPAPARAAEPEQQEPQETYAEPAPAQPEAQSEVQPEARAAVSDPGKFLLLPKTSYTVTTRKDGIRSRFGADLNGNGKPALLKLSDMPTTGYDGYQPVRDDWGMFSDDFQYYARWEERANFKNSDIIYIPFQVQVTIPAHTEYTLKIKPGGGVQRNSKGAAGYYLEIFDWKTTENPSPSAVTFMTGDTDQPSPNSNVLTRSGGNRIYSDKNSGPIGATFTLDPVVVANTSDEPKTYTRYFGLLAGVGESGSALSSYHHQMSVDAYVTILCAQRSLPVFQSVAQVNGTPYDSIDKAQIAFNSAAGGATLTLLRDVSSTNIITLANSGGTVDLAGYTWTADSFKVNPGAGSGTLTIKNGTLKGWDSYALTKPENFLSTSCPVALNNVVVDCQRTERGIASGGNLTITGGKVVNAASAGLYLLSGTAEISGAEIDGVYYGVIESSGHTGNVTISNAVIKGDTGALNPVSAAAENVWKIKNDVTLTRHAAVERYSFAQIHFGSEFGAVHSLIQFDGKPAAAYTIAVPDPGEESRTLTTGLSGVSSAGDYLRFYKDNAYPGVAIAVEGDGQIAVRRAKVTFDPNGGTLGEGEDIRYTNRYGSVSSLPTPTNGAKTFAGWQMPDGTAVSRSTVFSGDTTVTARWESKSVTVTFDDDGKTTTKRVDCGEAYGTLPAPARTGYDFGGWYTAKDSGTQVTAETKVADDARDHTLYAKWTAKTCTVTFNALGGTLSGGTTRTVTYGEDYPELPTPTRENFVFGGWFLGADDKTAITAGSPVSLAGDHTLYAKWDARFPVTVTLQDGGKTETLQAYTNQPYGMATPTKEGYIFQGWNTKEDGTGSTVTASTIVTNETAHTLYAQWKVKTYYVYFSLNGGSGTAPAAKTVEYNAKLEKPDDPAAPAGFVFQGWCVSGSEPEKIWHFDDPVTGSMTLAAKWAKFEPQVTMDPNGGKTFNSETPVKYVGFDGDKYGTLPGASREGYIFAGWFTERDGGTQVKTGDKVGMQPVTIYAHWIRRTYPVTFNSRGGGSVDPVTVNHGDALSVAVPTPTKENYSFAGWENSSGEVWSTASAWTPGRTVTEPVTLYAKWLGESRTVTFNGSGGTLSGETTKTVTYGDPYGELPVPTYTETSETEKHHFVGWFTEENGGGEQITPTSIVNLTGDTTLYAHWQTTHTHKLGEGDTGSADDFTEWTSDSSLPTDAGTYYLTTDVNLTTPVTITADVTICLNGHTITYTGDSADYIMEVGEFENVGGTLTLCDCVGTGRIDGNSKACAGVLACINTATGKPSQVSIAFNLYGGTITGCKHGVVVGGRSTFKMYGGTITGNSIGDGAAFTDVSDKPYRETLGETGAFKQYGAGVYVQGGRVSNGAIITATFNMYGGEIKGNSAPDGAGVYAVSWDSKTGTYMTAIADKNITEANAKTTARFNMIGGSITGNTSGTSGSATRAVSGGVLLENCTAQLGNTPKITGNTGPGGAPRNLLFGQSPAITADSLMEGAEIGVSTSSDPAPVPGELVAVASAAADCSAYFYSDTAEYSVVYQNKKVQLSYGTFPEHTHMACGLADCSSHAGSAHTGAVTYTPLSRAKDNGVKELGTGNYVLTTDLDYKYLKISSGSTVNLCLNGHTLKGVDTDEANGVITVSSGATLNICDCSAERAGVITGGRKGGVATDEQGSSRRTVNMYGGAITGNTSVNGGGVYANSGQKISSSDTDGCMYFNMYGGEISGNQAVTSGTATGNGGGVYVRGTSAFNMYGGTIANNTAENQGGGIHHNYDVHLYGGRITGNTAAKQGGGVYTYNNPSTHWCLTLGGSIVIKDNQGSDSANNVYIANGVSAYRLSLDKENPFTEGASVGIRPNMSEPTRYFVSNNDGDMVKAAFPHFFSDLAEYPVVFDDSSVSSGYYLRFKKKSGGTGSGGGDTPPKQTVFTVIFDDGSGTPKSLTTDANGKLTTTPDTPAKPAGQSGVVFDGWYRGEEKADLTKAFTADTILEARWTACAHSNRTTAAETEATCTQGGSQTDTCPDCGETWTVTTAPLGHDWGGSWSQGDSQHTKTCGRSGCSETMAAPHNWEQTGSSSSSCETGGTLTYQCTDCKKTKTETLTATGHLWSDWTASGDANHSRTCSKCSKTETEGHAWTESNVTEPTCSAAGSVTRACAVCGRSVTATLDKLPHTYSGSWSDSGDGANHQRACTACKGEPVTEPHQWGIGVETKPATETETGTMTYTCLACGAEKTADIPKLEAAGAGEFTVAYDGGGDGVTGSASTETKAAGASFSLPNNPFTRTGYRFTGWGAPEGEEYKTYAAGAGYTMPSQDVTFTAQWELSLPVTLGRGESVTLPDGTTVERSPDGGTVTITPPGTNPDAKPTEITVEPGGTVQIKEEPKTGENPDGGTTTTERIVVEIPGGSTVQTGDGPIVKIPENNPVKVELDGSIDGLPAGSEITSGGTTVKTETGGGSVSNQGDVTFPEGGTVTVDDGSGGEKTIDIPKAKDGEEPIEITPGETKGTCTVTFDLGGHGTNFTGTATLGTAVDKPENPTAEGYLFEDWYAAPLRDEAGGDSYTPDAGAEPWDFAAPVPGDMTLYAKWKAANLSGKPTISKQPQDIGDLTVGEIPADTKLTVTASVPAGGKITYQWYEKGEDGTFKPIEGATGPSYTIPQDTGAGEHQYYCQVTNTEEGKTPATVTTNTVTVTVNPPHEHEWGEWRITKEPTLTETGTAERTCTGNSSHKDTENLPVLTDTSVWTAGEKKEPTESEDGSQKYTSKYGDVTVVIPATGHTHEWGDWKITKEPTLTETGTAERTCTGNSSHKDTKELPVLTDTSVWTAGEKKEPTESEDGSQKYTSEYGDVTVVIPATSHTHEWGEWSITKAPTLTETGTAERTCTGNSSHKDTKELPPLTDTSVWTPGKRVEPDGDTPGSQEYTSEYGTVTIEIPPAPPAGGKTPLNPGESIDLPGGGTVERDGDGDTVTIDKDGDGTPDITITVPVPPKDNDVLVDTETGGVDVPGGSTVKPGGGDTPEIKLPGGGKVDPEDGGVTPPPGGSVEVGGGDGKPGITVTPPAGGSDDDRKVKTDEDGKVEVPGGSTVKPGGGDTPEIKLPGGGKVDPEDGGVTPPPGGSVEVGGGDGKPEITVTPPAGGGDDDRKVKVDEDGKVDVPGGSTVKPGGGNTPEIKLPDGGKVDPDTGSTTAPEVEVDGTTVTPPTGGQDVTTDKDGNTPVGPGSTASKGEGDDEVTVTVVEGNGVVDKDGNVNFPDGDGKVTIEKGGNSTTVDIPTGGSVPTDSDQLHDISGTVDERGGSGTSHVEGAAVYLQKGVKNLAQTTTGAGGRFTFYNIPDGAYNIVAQAGDKTKTQIVTLSGQDAELTLIMPSDNVNSVVKVEGDVQDESAKISETVVGGLDEEAEEQKETNSIVTVTMTVAKEPGHSAEGASAIQNQASGQTVEFLSIKVEKTIVAADSGDEQKETINETRRILEIVIPYDFTGKKDVTVYRYHNGSAEPLRGGANEEGTFKLSRVSGLIHIYASKFSTYAIGYTEAGGDTPVPPTPPVTPDPPSPSVPPSGGDSGGDDDSGSEPTYTPTVSKSDHGKVEVSLRNPGQGATVTVTLTPDEGYQADGITVTGRDGRPVKVTDNGNGTYTFTQPGGSVTITARFKPAGGGVSDCPRDSSCPIWPYTDAGASAWYHDGVHYCIEHGLMSGYSDHTFKPDGSTSRAMIAAILWRLEGSPVVDDTLPFDDVAEDAWCADAVRWAAASGVVGGYGNGKFGPGNPITREQLAAMLYRYKQYKDGGFTGVWTFPLDFGDADQVSGWAYEPMCWMTMNGIIQGNGDGLLNPKGKATRAQAAAMLMRFCTKK